MAGFGGKFDSAKQDWETPQDLFDGLNAEFCFTLDAAASAENTKCGLFYDQESDAMVQDWAPHMVWLNPPYGDKTRPLSAWVKKARDEAKKGATTVLLIPARTNTAWFHDVCLAVGEVRFIRGRPKFSNATQGLPQPLCLVVFRP